MNLGRLLLLSSSHCIQSGMHQVREYRTKALGGGLGIAKEPAGNF